MESPHALSPLGRSTRAGTDVVLPPPRLQVYQLRVLITSIGLMALLAVVTIMLVGGLKVTTLDATNMSSADRSDRLDRYNTYSGVLGSVFTMPFQGFAAMLLPLFLLFATSKGLLPAHSRSLLARYAPAVLLIAIPFLMNQGMNALNVQFDSPVVEFIIAAEDLAPALVVEEFPMNVTSVTNSAQIAGISSLDTILRSAIQTTTVSTKTLCTFPYSIFDSVPLASFQYGFPQSAWLKDLQSESIASEEVFAFSMQDNFTAGSMASTTLPGGDPNKTALLFSYSFWTVWKIFVYPHYFNEEVSAASVLEATETADAATLLNNIQTLVNDLTTDLESQDAADFSNLDPSFWLNLSVPEITMEFANFDISPQIKFESVTLELPVKNQTMKEAYVTDDESNATSWSYDTVMGTTCNDYACLMRYKGSVKDRVKLLPICMTEANGSVESLSPFTYSYDESPQDCAYPSNSSILIISVAHHFATDGYNFSLYTQPDTGGITPILSIVNPRVIYSITVGRLSWTTEDLAEAYSAKCATGADCDGLRMPLDTKTQDLVLGKAHIPAADPVLYPYDFTTWQSLVQSSADLDSVISEIIYPPILPMVAGSLPWKPLAGRNCSLGASGPINNVVQRHIYSKDPVQVAYTAGLFWLFQSASVKEVAMTRENKKSLSFAGNRQWISARVSIPQTSAIITFVGCLMIIVAGLLITGWARMGQSGPTSRLLPHEVAGILVNPNRYPSVLMHAGVDVAALGKIHGDGAAKNVHEFEITGITLRHQTDQTDRVIAIEQPNTLNVYTESSV